MLPGVLGPDDLVLSSGVIGNPPLPELIEAAQTGGYAGLTLWPAAYHPACSPHSAPASLPEFQARIRESGLAVCDVDAAITWAGPSDPGPPYFEEASEALVFELADACGADGVNSLILSEPETDERVVAEHFAACCDRGAAHGLRVHLEFSRSRLPRDVASAARVVAAAGRANGGLMLDAWHLHWGAGAPEDLLGHSGALFTGIQLSDAPAQEPADFAYATRHERLLPGHGVSQPERLVATLREIGCVAPVTVEAFDATRLAAVGAVRFAREVADATRAVLARSVGLASGFLA